MSGLVLHRICCARCLHLLSVIIIHHRIMFPVKHVLPFLAAVVVALIIVNLSTMSPEMTHTQMLDMPILFHHGGSPLSSYAKTNETTATAADHLAAEPAHTNNSPFAYAFLMAGCSENGMHRGFIYNILVAAYILQASGSTADIIVMVRMHAKSNLTQLPDQDTSLLTKMGVQIRYLPLESMDTFYTAMMAKFSVLEFTEYHRILFIDSDAIPLCNLDYLFHMSLAGKIRENVVLAWNKEPAAGGFFMLKPGGKDELDSIISEHHRYLKTLPRRVKFDVVVGWGHVIQPPDSWRALTGKSNRTLWDMYGKHNYCWYSSDHDTFN
jgi:hypothetical protein